MHVRQIGLLLCALLTFGYGQVENLSSVPGLDADVFTQSLSPILDKVDPSKDTGWDTEVFSAEASDQLGILAKAIEEGESSADALALFADKVRTTPWRPQGLSLALDGILRVSRESGTARKVISTTRKGMARQIASLKQQENVDDLGEMHVKFKVFRVEPGRETAAITAYYHSDIALPKGGKIEQNATLKRLCLATPSSFISMKRTRFLPGMIPTINSSPWASITGAAVCKETLVWM
jgi:hypothetical protein